MTHSETAAIILAQLKSMDLGDRVIDKVEHNAERDVYEATGLGPAGPIGLATKIADPCDSAATCAGIRLGNAIRMCAEREKRGIARNAGESMTPEYRECIEACSKPWVPAEVTNP